MRRGDYAGVHALIAGHCRTSGGTGCWEFVLRLLQHASSISPVLDEYGRMPVKMVTREVPLSAAEATRSRDDPVHQTSDDPRVIAVAIRRAQEMNLHLSETTAQVQLLGVDDLLADEPAVPSGMMPAMAYRLIEILSTFKWAKDGIIDKETLL